MTRKIRAGDKFIGGGPVTIQSMTDTLTTDVESTVRQINALSAAGADFVRVAVPDVRSARALAEIRPRVSVPLIGDFHYSAEPALIALDCGLAKARINPYNMPDAVVDAIARKCAERGVAIRVGVNNGSGPKRRTPEELAKSALSAAERLEAAGCSDLVLSVKTSDVRETVEAYRILSRLTDYPLHVGLTESGAAETGAIKSSVAIGALLLDGIGDTVRVSLSGDPLDEIRIAKKILRAVGLDRECVEIVACPTCGRTDIDVKRIALRLESLCRDVRKRYKVAVMGCAVNGIGEAGDADLGVAGGKAFSVLFRRGKTVGKVRNDLIESALCSMISEDLGLPAPR